MELETVGARELSKVFGERKKWVGKREGGFREGGFGFEDRDEGCLGISVERKKIEDE